MRYRNPETGEVFENIYKMLNAFCSKIPDCEFCQLLPKDGFGFCQKWVREHPAEAARLMGYEVIEDSSSDSSTEIDESPTDTPTAVDDTPTAQLVKQKPRLAKILGVEVGEEFNVKDFDDDVIGPFHIDTDGYMRWCGEDGETSDECVYIAINHPERIIRAPHLTEPEIAIMRAVGAKWVSRDERINGFCDLWENKPSVCEGLYANRDKETVPLASVKSRLFPTVKPGDCVEVAE